MAKARQLAEETMEKGRAERRDWNPGPDSAHVRVYRWWARRSKNVPVRENFCHYWRVVLIWAPLRWIAKPLLITLGVAALAGVVWLFVLYPPTMLTILLGIIGFCVALAYMMYMVMIVQQLLEDLELRWPDNSSIDWFGVDAPWVKVLLTAAAFPLLIVVPVALVTFGAEKRYQAYSRSWRWFVSAHPKPAWLTWLRPWLVIPAGLVVLASVPSPAQLTGFILLCVFAGIAAVVGIVMVLAFVADRHRQREAERRKVITAAAVADQRPPRLVRRTATSIGDYLSLIWSVMLTNKWKICPWVEIPR